MTDGSTLVYLEADDEITTVVRRVRSADPGRVVVVAPGRARATSSAVALRLLARTAAEDDRDIVVVGDALTRSLAAEAGLPAYASVGDARAATLDGATPAPDEPQHATIHVVRGPAADDAVAAPGAVTAPIARTARGGDGVKSMDETRAVPVAPRPEPVVPRRAPVLGERRVRRTGLAVLFGAVGATLLAATVAGAMLLPAATITVVPRREPVAETYELVVEDVVRRDGTVEASGMVVAGGTYEIVEPARGVVTFRNFNTGTVEVPAGTLVAAELQAFETTEAVAVPSGSLTPAGTIAAGEADAPVVASAAGPDANLAAEAIDTVLSEDIAARLRLFPQNNARLVINAEPTSGGVDESGPEITQADVDAAVEELRSELRREAAEASPDFGDLMLIDVPMSEPRIEVPNDLVGMRDQGEVEITGELDWQVVGVDTAPLEAEAEERLINDADAIPQDHEIVPGSIAVELGAPRLDGERVIATADVSGSATPALDRAAATARVAGLTEEEAELALADIGEADVELWPEWAESVPELDWRVEVRIEELAP